MNKICCPYLKNTIKTCDDLKKEKQVITVKILRVKIVINTSQFIKYKKIVTNNDKMDIKWKWWYKSKGLSPSDLKIKNIQK